MNSRLERAAYGALSSRQMKWRTVAYWTLLALVPFCFALMIIERVKREWLNGWPTYLGWAIIGLGALGLLVERFVNRSAKSS